MLLTYHSHSEIEDQKQPLKNLCRLAVARKMVERSYLIFRATLGKGFTYNIGLFLTLIFIVALIQHLMIKSKLYVWHELDCLKGIHDVTTITSEGHAQVGDTRITTHENFS